MTREDVLALVEDYKSFLKAQGDEAGLRTMDEWIDWLMARLKNE